MAYGRGRARRRSTPETVKAKREERGQITEVGPVIDAAAAFLAVRPRSVGETRKRLHQLGYPQGLVDEVLERFAEVGYLDDEAFARAWVESRDRARPRGETALRRELAADESQRRAGRAFGGGDRRGARGGVGVWRPFPQDCVDFGLPYRRKAEHAAARAHGRRR